MSTPRKTNLLTFSASDYFTDKKPPHDHNSLIFKGLDYLGRFLSFRSDDPSTPKAIKIISRIFVYLSGGVLGLLGATSRFIASYSKNLKIDQPPPLPSTAKMSSDEWSSPDETKDDKEFSLGIYTLNTGLMTRLPFAKNSFINASFLGSNHLRASGIADDILALSEKGLDIVQLQEVFDEASEKILRAKLKDTFPYCVHSIGNAALTVGSGLLFFSKYPIIDIQFLPYDHSMLGEETLGNKGALLVVLQVGDKKVLSIGTHTQSGGGIIKSISEPWDGTTGDRRAKQMAQLDHAIQAMEEKHSDLDLTILSGDLNHHAENIAKQHSVSQGQRKAKNKSKSGHLQHVPAPEFGQIKHPEINELMGRFNVRDPNLESLPDAQYSPLDEALEKDHKGYKKLKYTRGPFNYREVKIGGKTNPTHNWKQFQKEIYESQITTPEGEVIPIYTGTAVVDACLEKNKIGQVKTCGPLADQGKLIDVNLVSSVKERKITVSIGEKNKKTSQGFTLFKPSDQYQQQSCIHNVQGRSDHHALITKVTTLGSKKGIKDLWAIAKDEVRPEVLAETKKSEQPRRSCLEKLGYR